MVDLCGEFLHAGTETTFVALEWIMANLVKHPHTQRKLYDEVITLVGPPPELPPPGVEPESVINEDDIQKMLYLKAVVLEGLRRHPPAHFLLHHRVMKDVELQGYVIPHGATINFMAREMGLDPEVWDDPMDQELSPGSHGHGPDIAKRAWISFSRFRISPAEGNSRPRLQSGLTRIL
ncbi:cytochrome P450 89A2, partial [Tanacetum coccineum]